MTPSEYSQIYTVEICPHLLRIIIKDSEWVAGEIDTEERIFYSHPRTSKNLFYLFDNKGSLGINAEILTRNDFDKVYLKFNGKILTTTRRKWLAKGVSSPYSNKSVDSQILLSLDEINMTNVENYEPSQSELFTERI